MARSFVPYFSCVASDRQRTLPGRMTRWADCDHDAAPHPFLREELELSETQNYK